MMKKLSFILILLLSLLTTNTAFANGSDKIEKEPLPPIPFEFVTSEKDDFKPENEYSITFAKAITINAETLKGANVTVTVSFDKKLEIEPEAYEAVTIGATLKFIQPVALKLGDNTVNILIEKDGYEPTEISLLIKRKDSSILDSLQNIIIVPGLSN